MLKGSKIFTNENSITINKRLRNDNKSSLLYYFNESNN